jgi:hypothetical protein
VTKFFKRTKDATSLFLADPIGLACRQIRQLTAREKGRGGSVVGGRASGKRKLRCFAARLLLKVRKRYAHESNAPAQWEYRSDKAESQLM